MPNWDGTPKTNELVPTQSIDQLRLAVEGIRQVIKGQEKQKERLKRLNNKKPPIKNKV
jgi:hypothetical protein